MRHRLRRHLWLTPWIAGGVAVLVTIGARTGAAAPARDRLDARDRPAETRQAGPQESGARVTFADGRISFVGPPGFTALTAEELAVKYPQAGGPRRAIGNTRRTTSIAYDLLDQRAPSTDLEAARAFFAQTYEKALPNLKWVVSDVRRLANREWAYLEFTSSASDQDLHNIVLVSVYDSRVLLFNFNSTTREFPSVERALRASMASIATTP